MNAWPLSIKKMQDGKELLILFDDNSEFSISAELLIVEGPSADIQGHGGPKFIVKNKNDILISRIEEVGNYAIRIIFSDDHSSGIFSWDLLYDFGKNQKKYFQAKDIRVNTEIIDACKDYNLADQIAMICPLDSEEKQLLLETLSITKRNALLLSIIESYTSEANISEVIKH